MRWKTIGDVAGVGWLEALGPSLITALAAWQALAARRVAEQAEMEAAAQDGAS